MESRSISPRRWGEPDYDPSAQSPLPNTFDEIPHNDDAAYDLSSTVSTLSSVYMESTTTPISVWDRLQLREEDRKYPSVDAVLQADVALPPPLPLLPDRPPVVVDPHSRLEQMLAAKMAAEWVASVTSCRPTRQPRRPVVIATVHPTIVDCEIGTNHEHYLAHDELPESMEQREEPTAARSGVECFMVHPAEKEDDSDRQPCYIVHWKFIFLLQMVLIVLGLIVIIVLARQSRNDSTTTTMQATSPAPRDGP